MSTDTLRDKYEVVIGLEVHAQLKSQSKIFAPDANEFGQDPNLNTSEITLGMPGVLPVLNKKCVELAILTGLALNSKIPERCKFDRKQYFYPDLPKGYQISQYDEPICLGGSLEIDGKVIGITRAHLEEDAGKLVHAGSSGIAGSSYSLVDLNRAGTPLLEIVSEPDMRSSKEARSYMEKLRTLLRYINVCDGNLEEGSMRCDANISIRPYGQEEFGTRAEIKNVNSFRALERAIEFEIDRQIEIVEEGGEIVQETRLWDDNEGITKSMRSKEDAHDYRYFPEPDLMPLKIPAEWISKIKESMPELPEQKKQRYVDLGISEYDAGIIIDNMETALFFDELIKLKADARMASNFLNCDIAACLKEENKTINQTELKPPVLAELISLIQKGTISNNIAKSLLPELLKQELLPSKLVEERGLAVISDTSSLENIIKEIIEANPEQVQAYKGGKDKLLGFFVGQAMKQTKGRANPQLLNNLVKKMLA